MNTWVWLGNDGTGGILTHFMGYVSAVCVNTKSNNDDFKAKINIWTQSQEELIHTETKT